MQPTPPNGREIHNVALLDLTGAQAAAALDGVTRISNVATILVPVSLLPKLSSIPMDHVAATIPVADGRRARVMAGQITLSGEALAGSPDHADDVLVVAGQLVITSPVSQVGYEDLVVLGQAVAPAGSETALGAALTRLSGNVVYYPYVEGSTTRLLSGSSISGEALANLTGQPTDILLATGLLVVSSPVTAVGFQQVVAIGHVVVPQDTPAEFLGKMQSMTGQLTTYTAPPRVFEGKDHFSAGFFELLRGADHPRAGRLVQFRPGCRSRSCSAKPWPHMCSTARSARRASWCRCCKCCASPETARSSRSMIPSDSVSTARQHQQQQFDALYATHHATLHAYFLGKTSDAELALDLLQDAFVRAWRNLATLEGLPPERQRMWLFAVARNLVVDQYRWQATRRSTDAALAQAAAGAQTSSPAADADLLTRERLQALDRAIHQLPEDLRVVLVLQAVGERNSTEIGELLGRPPGTVRYQLAEARRRLARQLQLDQEHDDD